MMIPSATSTNPAKSPAQKMIEKEAFTAPIIPLPDALETAILANNPTTPENNPNRMASNPHPINTQLVIFENNFILPSFSFEWFI